MALVRLAASDRGSGADDHNAGKRNNQFQRFLGRAMGDIDY